MRALIVTSMWPSASAPARGSFVRDQVAALEKTPGVDVEVFAFPPRGYARAARDLRRRFRKERFDVVHAHFGLTAWPALAVRHATRVVTLHGTAARGARRTSGAPSAPGPHPLRRARPLRPRGRRQRRARPRPP